MLESMVDSPYPTRAEVSDIANAIFDGADAVMLSEETATGSYPLEAVTMMASVAIEASAALPYRAMLREKGEAVVPQPDEAIAHSAVSTAQQLHAALILAFTTSGSTAMRVAKFRPECPVLALTSREDVLRRLVLFWGLTPHLVGQYTTIESVFAEGADIARLLGLAGPGDLVVMTVGVPFGVPGNTNMLKIQRVN
jgi:pyruvate kinase